MGISLSSNKNHYNNSTIELVKRRDITQKLINEIYEIEQDVWARFLGEYLSCDDCGNIMSKDDVYITGNNDYSGINIKNHTVAELERLLGETNVNCSHCGGDTSHIFGEDFKDEIASRAAFDEHYLIVQKSIKGKVLGFASSYVSDFDTIYERELNHYYSKLGRAAIRERVEQTLGETIPNDLLCFAAIGNAPNAASFQNLHLLFRYMFQLVEAQSPGLIGIYETVIGSMTHTILKTCNAKRIYTNPNNSKNVHSNIQSDIFVHEKMAEQGLDTLGVDCKNYIKNFGERLRKIRE